MVAYLSCVNKLIKLLLPPDLASEKKQRMFQLSKIREFAQINKISILENPTLSDQFAKDLVKYFSGTPVDFKQEVNLDSLTSFTKAVLQTAAKIPYGETISYGQLAKKIKQPRAYRGVARALSINPIPILIPCHRIICTDGSLGGYSAASGPAFKSELLQMESRQS